MNAVSELVTEVREHHVFLYGEGGIGKSTLLKKLCRELLAEKDIVPIYVDVKSIQYRDTEREPLLTYIAKNYCGTGVDAETLRGYFDELQKKNPPDPTTYVIMVDGLNEANRKSADRESLTKDAIVTDIGNLLHCDVVRFVCSSRIREPYDTFDAFRTYSVRQLDEAQTKAYMKSCGIQGYDQLEDSTKRILENPFFLVKFCVLYQGKELEPNLRINRGELLHAFVEQLKNSTELDPAGQNDRITDKSFCTDYFLPLFGFEMMRNGGMIIEAGKAKDFRNPDTYRTMGVERAPSGLNQWFSDDQEIDLNAFSNCINIAVKSFAIISKGEDKYYQFAHQIWRDYFIASYYCTEVLPKRQIDPLYFGAIESDSIRTLIGDILGETGFDYSKPEHSPIEKLLRREDITNPKLIGYLFDIMKVCKNADLSDVDLSGLDLSWISFQGCILKNADMKNCKFSERCFLPLTGISVQDSSYMCQKCAISPNAAYFALSNEREIFIVSAELLTIIRHFQIPDEISDLSIQQIMFVDAAHLLVNVGKVAIVLSLFVNSCLDDMISLRWNSDFVPTLVFSCSPDGVDIRVPVLACNSISPLEKTRLLLDYLADDESALTEINSLSYIKKIMLLKDVFSGQIQSKRFGLLSKETQDVRRTFMKHKYRFWKEVEKYNKESEIAETFQINVTNPGKENAALYFLADGRLFMLKKQIYQNEDSFFKQLFVDNKQKKVEAQGELIREDIQSKFLLNYRNEVFIGTKTDAGFVLEQTNQFTKKDDGTYSSELDIEWIPINKTEKSRFITVRHTDDCIFYSDFDLPKTGKPTLCITTHRFPVKRLDSGMILNACRVHGLTDYKERLDDQYTAFDLRTGKTCSMVEKNQQISVNNRSMSSEYLSGNAFFLNVQKTPYCKKIELMRQIEERVYSRCSFICDCKYCIEKCELLNKNQIYLELSGGNGWSWIIDVERKKMIRGKYIFWKKNQQPEHVMETANWSVVFSSSSKTVGIYSKTDNLNVINLDASALFDIGEYNFSLVDAMIENNLCTIFFDVCSRFFEGCSRERHRGIRQYRTEAWVWDTRTKKICEIRAGKPNLWDENSNESKRIVRLNGMVLSIEIHDFQGSTIAIWKVKNDYAETQQWDEELFNVRLDYLTSYDVQDAKFSEGSITGIQKEELYKQGACFSED